MQKLHKLFMLMLAQFTKRLTLSWCLFITWFEQQLFCADWMCCKPLRHAGCAMAARILMAPLLIYACWTPPPPKIFVHASVNRRRLFMLDSVIKIWALLGKFASNQQDVMQWGIENCRENSSVVKNFMLVTEVHSYATCPTISLVLLEKVKQ